MASLLTPVPRASKALLSRDVQETAAAVSAAINTFCGVLVDMGEERVMAGLDIAQDEVVIETINGLVTLSLSSSAEGACADITDASLQEAWRARSTALAFLVSDLLKTAELNNLHAGKLAHAVSALKEWLDASERKFAAVAAEAAPEGAAAGGGGGGGEVTEQ